jgi:uncharacterized membrane protein (DUF373 family)
MPAVEAILRRIRPMSEQLAQRDRIASAFRFIEHAFYFGVAVAMAIGGIVLFFQVGWTFFQSLGGDPRRAILQFLEGLLLVFILAELIHTVRAVIEENVLRTEPFLIVGIVAAIRRMLVITADADRYVGQAEFRDLVLEMAVLAATVVLLGVTIYLVRHTTQSEPVPAHERREAEKVGAAPPPPSAP